MIDQVAELTAAALAEEQNLDADHVVRTYPAHDAMRAEAEAVYLEAEIEVIADAAHGTLSRPDEAAVEAEVDHFARDVPVVDAEVDGAVAQVTR